MAAVKESPEIIGKRQSAVYVATTNHLRRSREDLRDKEIDALALEAVDHAVYGFDAKKDRKGNYIEQGIGAKGRETGNHFAAIRRYEGKEAWEAAVREIWKRDPKRAEYLRLPKLAEKAA